MRIGQGFDAHRLVSGRDLYLGGVFIPHERGLDGHSDGDVLLHAITSALLGALGDGDLGSHFPSSDPRLAGVSSGDLLRETVGWMADAGYRLGNVDATIIAQEPKLAPFQERMCTAVAELLGAPTERVNVKITSTDQLGAIGRGEGIAAQAIVLLHRTGRRA